MYNADWKLVVYIGVLNAETCLKLGIKTHFNQDLEIVHDIVNGLLITFLLAGFLLGSSVCSGW